MALKPVSGTLMLLPAAALAALQTNAIQALQDIMISGQAHTIAGRSFSQANLDQLSEFIAEINAALAQQAGTRVRKTLGYHGGFTR